LNSHIRLHKKSHVLCILNQRSSKTVTSETPLATAYPPLAGKQATFVTLGF